MSAPVNHQDLRSLPSVDQLLNDPQVEKWAHEFGRPLTLEAVREALAQVREHFPEEGRIPGRGELVESTGRLLGSWTAPTLQPVINASGVILQTNLGRAPLSAASLLAVQQVAQGYSSLEYDLQRGKRGSRLVHAEALLQRITGAEAAIVVNNNAAAVLLVLTALARRRSVVIARSQLVENSPTRCSVQGSDYEVHQVLLILLCKSHLVSSLVHLQLRFHNSILPGT